MQRREITLRNTKNGETHTVPMTPEVYRVFTELWRERRLDTHRVFLYKDRPIRDVKTAFDKACRRVGINNLRLTISDIRRVRISDELGWMQGPP
jgi:integrase